MPGGLERLLVWLASASSPFWTSTLSAGHYGSWTFLPVSRLLFFLSWLYLALQSCVALYRAFHRPPSGKILLPMPLQVRVDTRPRYFWFSGRTMAGTTCPIPLVKWRTQSVICRLRLVPPFSLLRAFIFWPMLPIIQLSRATRCSPVVSLLQVSWDKMNWAKTRELFVTVLIVRYRHLLQDCFRWNSRWRHLPAFDCPCMLGSCLRIDLRRVALPCRRRSG